MIRDGFFKSLVHRVLTDAGVAVAPALAVHQKVPVFGHLVGYRLGGCVGLISTLIIVWEPSAFDGLMHNARRFAIDWRKFKNGQQF